METASIQRILLHIVVVLALCPVSLAHEIIHPEGPQQCFTDTEKLLRIKCQLFQAQNELTDTKSELEEVKAELEEIMEAIQCGEPPATPHGSMNYTGTRLNDKASYSCEDGYEMEGDDVIKCGVNRTWAPIPCCRKDKTNITLQTVNWNNEDLTDTDVVEKLQNLSGYVGVLWLGVNRLTQIPALGEYHQLDTMSTLVLGVNEISTFTWDDIPINVSVLSLNHNELSILPVVEEAHRCLRVRELNLQYNNIRTLEARQLPVTVTKLRIYHNKLTSVGDLSSLPLTILDLSNNHLTEVNGDYLPVTLSELWLWGDRITVSGVSHLVNLSTVYVSRGNVQYYSEKFPQADIRGY